MIRGELTRRRLEETENGVSGQIVYLCDWGDVDPTPDPTLPQKGDSWPGLPYLRCVRRTAEEGDIGQCVFTCYYSTEGELAENYVEESIDVALEPGEEIAGWTWETAGTPVTDAIAPSVPSMTLTLRKRNAELPLQAVDENVGRVNAKRFRGINAGYLRFEGAHAESTVDNSGNVISCDSIYTFRVHHVLWNQMWRRPLQARDAEGNPLYWQNIDAAEAYYTTDMTLVATPVWINQVTGMELNPAGEGGYDKPMLGTSYLHDAVDFAEVLGLPKKVGDE